MYSQLYAISCIFALLALVFAIILIYAKTDTLFGLNVTHFFTCSMIFALFSVAIATGLTAGVIKET